MNENVVFAGFLWLKNKFPPCETIIRLLRGSPIPCPSDFVVKNGEKISLEISSGMGSPLLLISSLT